MNKPINYNTDQSIFARTLLETQVERSKNEQIDKALSLSENWHPLTQEEQAKKNLYIFASIVETYFDDLVLEVKRTAEYKAFNTTLEKLLNNPTKMRKIPWGLKKVKNHFEFINDDYEALLKKVVFYRIKKGLLKTRLFNTISEEAEHLLKVTYPPDKEGLNGLCEGDPIWKNQNDLERIIKRYKKVNR